MNKIPELDGLRGLAILLVLLFHGGPIWFGWIGVDLFFVLSGFLITGILLRTRRSQSYFVRFYKRRVLRIFPLYFAVLLLSFWVVPRLVSHPAALFPGDSGTRWPYFLFVQNLVLVSLSSGALFVTWSLAIEEQFYLVWPWLVRWLDSAALAIAAVALFGCLPLVRAFMEEHGAGGPDIHLFTLCRLDGLALGALVALAMQLDEPRRRRLERWALPIALIGLAGSVVTIARPAGWSRLAANLQYSFLALLFAGMLAIALQPGYRGYRALLRNRVLGYAGTISYGLYLLHPIVNGFTLGALHHLPFRLDVGSGVGWLVLRVGQLGLTFLVAGVSWRWFEAPISRWKSSWAP